MRKYAHNVDGNQARVFALWRKFGANVEDTSALGDGFPDAVVTHRGAIYLAELKNGNARTKPGTRAKQDLFARRQEAHGGRVYTIRDDRDALAMLGVAQ